MTTVAAIFEKQSKDMFRNIGVLAMFVVFPIVAFALENLIQNPYMEGGVFVGQMAAMFIAMGLVMSVGTIIAEDRENNSLRFLIIAGVKPMSYILGIGSFLFLASAVTSAAFGFIGGLGLAGLARLMPVMLSGAIASILLGAIIGMIAKNQQAATGMAMPIGMALGMGPIAATFNETVDRVFSVFYTQQVGVFVSDPTMSLTRPLATIWINIAVLAVVFGVVYNKKGRAS